MPSMGEPTVQTGIFEGVRVLELAQWVFVPAAGVVLADQGADVVKIENPATGDPYRGLMTQGIGAQLGNVNLNIEQNNRGKRSVGLDIRTEQGRELMYRLAEGSDVFLTNFRPEALARLGYDVEDLRARNPRIIYARGHGYGVRGGEANTPGYDSTAYWARGGFAHTLTPSDYAGEVASRGAIGDKPAAMNLAYGIAAALFKRERTGEAAIVDVSLLASARSGRCRATSSRRRSRRRRLTLRSSRTGSSAGTERRTTGSSPCRSSTKHIGRDGYARSVARTSRKIRATRPREARLQHAAEYETEVETTFAARTYEEWCAVPRDSLTPWAPVQSASEVARDPQVVANDYLMKLETEDGVPYTVANAPVEFDETPARPRRAPSAGQHTDEVMLELGLSWDEIIELKLAEILA